MQKVAVWTEHYGKVLNTIEPGDYFSLWWESSRMGGATCIRKVILEVHILAKHISVEPLL